MARKKRSAATTPKPAHDAPWTLSRCQAIADRLAGYDPVPTMREARQAILYLMTEHFAADLHREGRCVVQRAPDGTVTVVWDRPGSWVRMSSELVDRWAETLNENARLKGAIG